MKQNKPLFTIVTATRNRYRYLKTLYNSLVKQSYKNIEWVIGNDGSTDKTDKIIKLFIKENKIKIKYIRSNIRIGKTKIDNLIIPHASGQYLCYCGSDDYFIKDAFQNMFVVLHRCGFLVLHSTNHNIIDVFESKLEVELFEVSLAR